MRGLRIGQRARHLANRDRFEQLWLIPVWTGLGLASLAVAVLPFKQIAPKLGRFFGTTKPPMAVTDAQEARAIQIRRTVQLAAYYAPWRADCYPQAIVARALLGLYRLPFALSLGLKRDPESGKAEAHAWVQCGATAVTGGDGDSEYSVVAVFGRVAAAPAHVESD